MNHHSSNTLLNFYYNVLNSWTKLHGRFDTTDPPNGILFMCATTLQKRNRFVGLENHHSTASTVNTRFVRFVLRGIYDTADGEKVVELLLSLDPPIGWSGMARVRVSGMMPPKIDFRQNCQ
jgi:hypothetical protein